MSTVERIAQILATLSPEQREQVMCFVESISEQPQRPVKNKTSGERMDWKHES
jgi:hypothetical protein